MTAEEFKLWRKAHGWTQVECANELGVSRDTITDIERGKRGIKRYMELATRAVAAGLNTEEFN